MDEIIIRPKADITCKVLSSFYFIIFFHVSQYFSIQTTSEYTHLYDISSFLSKLTSKNINPITTTTISNAQNLRPYWNTQVEISDKYELFQNILAITSELDTEKQLLKQWIRLARFAFNTVYISND
ncbi:hypothetical protein Glove_461g61 [Diversispora epigaea]|uniref:Uncharacterized protein n=1 Tax=Diversispora epigaea TaxID=1348612 RepID=A0A397GMY5_9GLOM|nr:hypothetical protein Glove_461g61 [Diversispora epigaea]